MMPGVSWALVIAVRDALAAGDATEALALVDAALDEPGDPPTCLICGQRAWPGDVVRHVHSAHHQQGQLKVRRVAT
jgi:hypothetical protein